MRMLARLHWLAVLRQVAIPLTGIETLAVLLEKTTGRDPLPDWIADLHTGRTVGFGAVPQFGTGTPEPGLRGLGGRRPTIGT